jgi:hypothetical protein
MLQTGGGMHELKRRSFIGKMGAYLTLVPIALTSTVALARTSKRREVSVSDDERIAAMERQMELMAARLATLEDVEAIRKLQHAFGYYLDKCLYDEVVDLFADDGDIHIGDGIYRGKAGQRRFFTGRLKQEIAGGVNGPVYGLLLEHLTLQDVIDVAPDRRTAKGRFRCLVQGGSHDSRQSANPGNPRQWWEGGLYENAYAKGDDGRWRLKLLSYRTVYQAPYETGWAHTRIAADSKPPQVYPADPLGPDEALPMPAPVWPETPVVPFHYPNPVSGKPWV